MIDVITWLVTDRLHVVMISINILIWAICNRLGQHGLVAFVTGDWQLLESLAEVIQRVIALCLCAPYGLD
jgi:hypothetical protein